MEPHEVALSDVHVGKVTQVTGETVCSVFPRTDPQSEASEGGDDGRDGDVAGVGRSPTGENVLYQIHLTEFTFECELEKDDEEEYDGVETDEDGDLILHRKSKQLCSIKIEHTMSTRLVDVGHQVWRGSLLLSDFILAHQDIFSKVTVLELGAGVGLASVAMATVAKKVICTDIGESVLNLCRRNAELNRHLFLHDQRGSTQNVVLVRELDWTKKGITTADSQGLFSWSSADQKILDEVTVIIAADVIYNEDLTADFFSVIHNVMSKPPDKVLYLAVERRLNFTLDDLEVSCPAYTHFLSCLKDLCQAEGKTKFTAEQMDTDFTQRLRYERSRHLVLWKISAATNWEGVT